MEFGITLFPDVGPEEKAPEEYYRESFDVVERAEQLGYAHVRSIEHHFTGYGGYSPSSTVMLAGLSGRTKTMKLITGAVIPAFNNPLKIAGELGMLDAMSNGRLMVGFGRAFLPHEFTRFGVSRDESHARFREGMDQIVRLLTEENVTSYGQCYIDEIGPNYSRAPTGVVILWVSSSLPPTAGQTVKPLTGLGTGANLYTGSEIPCVAWHRGAKIVALEYGWDVEVGAATLGAIVPKLIAAAHRVYPLYS